MTRLMKSNRFVHAMALVLALGALTAHEVGDAAEASATYSYDEIGRLRNATTVGVDTGAVNYTYDAAGNRTNVSAGVSPSTPPSITVPGSSLTGSYSVTWTASATGTVTAYQLFEANNSNFTGETQAYSGTNTTASLSGRGNGTYYYRVRACNGTFCSQHRVGGNPTAVTLPPSTPASISAPSPNLTGSYTISWAGVPETFTAYQLYEANNAAFTGETQVYSGATASAPLSGRGNGTYYYRVRACNVTACSGFRTSGALVVTLPPGTPTSLTVPMQGLTTGFNVSWGGSSGTVTAYELYERTTPATAGEVLVYSGTGTTTTLAGRAIGLYFYRVRACNGGACSGYRDGSNAVSVVPPIGVLNPNILVPNSGFTTSINTLAHLNGNPGTIHVFTLVGCSLGTASIQSGAQSVLWNNQNTYYHECTFGSDINCSANYTIRNSNTGDLYNGTSAVTIQAQPLDLPPGQSCN